MEEKENRNVIELNEDDYREVKSSDEPEAEDFCEVEAVDEPESVELEYKPSPSVSAMYAELCRKREESKKLKKGKKHKAHKKKGKKKAKYKRKRDADYALYWPSSEPMLPDDAVSLSLQHTLEESTIRRVGMEVPVGIQLSPGNSGVIFGLCKDPTDKPLAGKPAVLDGHVAVFGGSGAGKSTGIAMPTIISWKGPVFTFDFKGDLTRLGERRNANILYLVRGYRNTLFYDPFLCLRKDGKDNLIQNARELAHAIIPLPHTVKEPFWIDSARDVLTGSIVYFFNRGVSFVNAINEIKTTALAVLIEKVSTDEQAAPCLNPDITSSPKMLAGVSQELHNRISVFATDTLIQDVFSPAEDGSKVPLDWEKLEREDIFVRIDQSRIGQWGGLIRLMLVQLIRALERRPEKYEPEGRGIKPTLLLLDELPQYGKVEEFTNSMRVLRSKNVTFALFCQSLADLDEIYGADTRRTILDNCPYLAVLGANDTESQQYFSAKTGVVRGAAKGISKTYDLYGYQTGYHASVSETVEPAIFPHEFGSLSDVVFFHPEGFSRLTKIVFHRQNDAGGVRHARLPG